MLTPEQDRDGHKRGHKRDGWFIDGRARLGSNKFARVLVGRKRAGITLAGFYRKAPGQLNGTASSGHGGREGREGRGVSAETYLIWLSDSRRVL